MITAKFKKLIPTAQIPTKATPYAACYDLYSVEKVILLPDRVLKVKTGLSVEVPEGYMLEIRARSGLSSKGILLPNAPGTLDSDYRGEIMVLLTLKTGINPYFYQIEIGDRIAQCRLVKLEDYIIEEVEELSETNRGVNGFGSSGK